LGFLIRKKAMVRLSSERKEKGCRMTAEDCLIAEALEALTNDITIPPQLTAGLYRYLSQRIPTGDFLRAVLENNFMEAISRAHPGLTLSSIKSLCTLMYTVFPSSAFGSHEAVDAWLAGGQN
jgi:hypothetical protein